MDFFHLFPSLQAWVQSLATIWPASIIKPSIWMFAVIEAVHLLALAAIGGCVIVLNMRLMGLGLKDEPASTVERNIRGWQLGGVLVVLATGVAIGMSNADKLYTSPAFFVKMLSMTAALILSLGVTSSVAQNEGAVTLPAKVMAGIAFIIWLASIYVFGTVKGANPGTFHLVCAGWLIAMAFGSGMTRGLLGAITAVVVVAVGVTTYLVFNPTDNYDLVMAINAWTVRVAAVTITGFIAYDVISSKSDETNPSLAKLIGVFTILAWVTVGASGRWIGLS